MSIEKAKECLRRFGAEDRIQEFDVSSATVDLAAAALGVDASRIAKTLSFKKDGGCLLVVTSGDARVDNRKFKDTFACKAKMLTPEEAESLIGHSVGGVCPFGMVGVSPLPKSGVVCPSGMVGISPLPKSGGV